MSQNAEPSGVDLARVALRAAQEAAKKTGARTAKSKPQPTRTVRGDGRAPMGLGEAFTALMADRGWETPTAGAGLYERWAVLAPDLAEHVANHHRRQPLGAHRRSPYGPRAVTRTTARAQRGRRAGPGKSARNRVTST